MSELSDCVGILIAALGIVALGSVVGYALIALGLFDRYID